MNEDRSGAMTVNELLFAAGLLCQFDQAARRSDKEQMIAILQQAGLKPGAARETAEAVVADPQKYGY